MSEFFDFDAYERDMNEVETMTAAIESRVKRTTPERRLHTSGDASGSPSYGFTIFPQTPFTSSAPSPMLSLSLSGSDMDVDLELTAHSPVNEANTRSASTFPAVGAEGNIPSGKEGDGANGSRVTGSKRKSKSTHYEDQTGEDLSVNMYNYLPFFSDPREIQTPPELHVAQAQVEATTPEADAHYPSMNTNTKTESSIAELAPSQVQAEEDLSTSPPSTPLNRKEGHYEPPMTRMRARGRSQTTSAASEPEPKAKSNKAKVRAKQKEQLPQYEVHRILASVIIEGLLYYRAAWKGWGAPDPNFYAARNFKTSPDRLMAFHDRYPKLPGPSKRLDVWKEAFDNGEVAEAHDDDDFPVEK